MKPNDGGPAYLPNKQWDRTPPEWRGPSLRDWFAGQALAGHDLDGNWSKPLYAELAQHCYLIADAMLAERAEEKS